MELIDRRMIADAFRTVGLRHGDTVYIQSDLARIGALKGMRCREDLCGAYVGALFDVIGDEGTLVVPTYTTQVARYDIDFVLEETPTLLGIFADYVRTLPGSVRSLHPVHSFAAMGAGKERICVGNGTSDFGWDSPPHRLLEGGAKIVSIGLESGYAVGLAHHLEAAYCLPYVYNKLLKWQPIANGIRCRRQYFGVVRHLYLKTRYDLTDFVRHMRSLQGLWSARLGGGWVHATRYEQAFAEGGKILRDRPYFLLAHEPAFEYGVIPFDGPTCGADGIGGQISRDQVEDINWSGFYLAGKNFAGGDSDELDGDVPCIQQGS